MIAFALTAAPPLSDYERRCREQIAELRADASLAHERVALGLCAGCGGELHAGICALVLGHADRKGIGLCTTAYCKQPCVDGESVKCDGHRTANARYVRDHREKTGRTRRVGG